MLKRISAVLHRMVVTWMWENVVQWGCECGGAWSCSWLYSDTWNSCNCMQDRVRTSPHMAYTVMLLWYSYFERNGQKWGGKLKLIGIAIMYKHQFLPPPLSLFIFQYFNCSVLIVKCAHDRGLLKPGAVAMWSKPCLTILRGFLTVYAHQMCIYAPLPPRINILTKEFNIPCTDTACSVRNNWASLLMLVW